MTDITTRGGGGFSSVPSYGEGTKQQIMSERQSSTPAGRESEKPDAEGHKILAANHPESADGAFLVVAEDVDGDDLAGVSGYLIDRGAATLFPVEEVLSVIRQGYWEDYDADPDELERLITCAGLPDSGSQ